MASSRNLVGVETPAPADAAVPVVGRFHVLVIGINRYRHWTHLTTAVNGARELSALLKSDYGFTDARELLDEGATRAAIIGELNRQVDTLKPEDSVLIYFAGHGHIDGRTGTGAWIPVDAKVEERGREYDAPATWLENDSIRRLLKACKARHILLVSDSCFSGDFLRGMREAPPLIDDAYIRAGFALRSRQVLTAGALHPVMDGGLSGHSVFTGFLLHGLRDHNEPCLLPAQLHARLRGGVAENAAQQPLFGTLHDTGGEAGGEFVFFRRGYDSVDAAIAENRRRLEEMERLRLEAQAVRIRFTREIEAKKAEAAELTARIADFQAGMNTGPAGGSLDELVALTEQREKDAEELARLEEAARLDAKRRREELAALERQEREQRREAFEASVVKYHRVRDSKAAGAELVLTAWRELCRMWAIQPAPEVPGDLTWDGQAQRPRLSASEQSLFQARWERSLIFSIGVLILLSAIVLLLVFISELSGTDSKFNRMMRESKDAVANSLSLPESMALPWRDSKTNAVTDVSDALFRDLAAKIQHQTRQYEKPIKGSTNPIDGPPVTKSTVTNLQKAGARRVIQNANAGLTSGTTNNIEPVRRRSALEERLNPFINPESIKAQAVGTKSSRFENTLGMKFAAVEVSMDGNQAVLFSIWETRVKDYAAYAAAKAGVDGSWKAPVWAGQPVTPGPEHPVVNVSWEDAKGFCAWLTAKERAERKIGADQEYRLPMDAWWSRAVGIGEAEEKAGAGRSSKDKDEKIETGQHSWAHPWGKDWPPVKGAGNYGDASTKAKFPSWSVIEGYEDGYATSSPVGSFPANSEGLHDLGGNVWEWCEDFHDWKSGARVLRGASWSSDAPRSLLSSSRDDCAPDVRYFNCGFRVVLVSVSAR